MGELQRLHAVGAVVGPVAYSDEQSLRPLYSRVDCGIDSMFLTVAGIKLVSATSPGDLN
jgi:hypothetical protein